MMKQASLFLLLLVSITISSTSFLSATCPALAGLNFDDSDPEALLVSWQSAPEHVGFEISFKGPVDQFNVYTTLNFVKLDAQLLEDNSHGIIKFAVSPDCGGGNYAAPIQTPLVEVEIIYDLCDSQDFDPYTDYMIYRSIPGGIHRIGEMRGECICNYRAHSNSRYPLHTNVHTLRNCNSPEVDCVNVLNNEKKYFIGIFNSSNAEWYMNHWSAAHCKPKHVSQAKTAYCDDFSAPEIAVYPNPSSDIIHVSHSSTSESEGSFEIMVYDANGQEVLNRSMTGQQSSSLNLEHLASGIYLITVRSDDAVIHQEKLIKL